MPSKLKSTLLLSAVATSLVAAGAVSATTLKQVESAQSAETLPSLINAHEAKASSIHDYTDRIIIEFNQAPMALMSDEMSATAGKQAPMETLVSALSQRTNVGLQHVRALSDGKQVLSLNGMTDMKALRGIIKLLNNDPMVSFAEPDHRRKFMAQTQP